MGKDVIVVTGAFLCGTVVFKRRPCGIYPGRLSG
jgi:hypothetical protein